MRAADGSGGRGVQRDDELCAEFAECLGLHGAILEECLELHHSIVRSSIVTRIDCAHPGFEFTEIMIIFDNARPEPHGCLHEALQHEVRNEDIFCCTRVT